MTGRTGTRANGAAIALLSGGLDSVVATALWLDAGGTVADCLTFDYGQRAAAAECAAALRFARNRDLPWRRIELPWLTGLARTAGSALVDGDRALPDGTVQRPGDDRTAAAVWVPARNAVFLAVAAACAEAAGVPVLLAGFNREEAATFSDNSPAFVAAAEAFFALGTRRGVRVAAPTLAFDKVEIVGQARRLGIGPGDVWSCYRGGPDRCGRCESCCRAERAWAAD